MYQEWFEEYEKITNKNDEDNYCPMCGRKLKEGE